jgi:hypothetical protein
MTLSSSASTLQMRSCSSTSISMCSRWSKLNTRQKRLTGQPLSLSTTRCVVGVEHAHYGSDRADKVIERQNRRRDALLSCQLWRSGENVRVKMPSVKGWLAMRFRRLCDKWHQTATCSGSASPQLKAQERLSKWHAPHEMTCQRTCRTCSI